MTAADIVAARPRLAAVVAATPCAYSETLSVMTGSRVFVKLENLQVTLQLGSAERRRGVIAASAGNHALGVAFHAARLGIAAVVVMPEWAPLETSGRDQIETITRHLPQAGYTVDEVAQHRVGDPDMAPVPPDARKRPGKAVALLDAAIRSRAPSLLPPGEREVPHGRHARHGSGPEALPEPRRVLGSQPRLDRRGSEPERGAARLEAHGGPHQR